ncbi:unnamed protein product [Oikopleura dioica]|uniref:Uncharacterized protein n=1 Tax=Oikopleura dioica TaxID=34765 RepID=E4YHG3_OIKDI|nr:unnamed protein product [Oikopleura dioica]
MDQGHAPTTGHLLRVQATLTSNTDHSVKGAKQSANVISPDKEPILIMRLILNTRDRKSAGTARHSKIF